MSIEAMKQALEALVWEAEGWEDVPLITRNAINALRAAIEQAQEPQCAHGIGQKECDWCGPAPKQEPVAWYGVNIAGVQYLGWKYEELDNRGFDVFPLYTAPQPMARAD